ncbi:hypothetical protein [Thermococcus sp.]|uniref:hypothetical protein n=1 Tax=Thermococcus sp. TaxID=35749 RepID=UPI0026061654|nr:hypothetical protein [Thermococcus sp.]
MRGKVLAISLILFVSFALVSVFWSQIAERANPSPPRLENLTLRPGLVGGPEVDGVYTVEGPIIDSCAVAYTYTTTGSGQVEVYELDDAAYSYLRTGRRGNETCRQGMKEGTVILKFDQPMESLSVSVWIGRTAEDGDSVYFQLLGTWRFADNASAVFIRPSPEKDFKLMSLKELSALVNSSGLYGIPGRNP